MFEDWDWRPPEGWTVIETLDAHAAGEPLRIITAGLPPVPGATILDKRRFFRDHLDWVRTGLMHEPRGHGDMYGAVLTEPVTPDGDLGVFFLHNEGYSTMCGHAMVALGTALVDTGLLRRGGDAPEIRLDTPAGRVAVTAHREGGRVRRVTFRNVPSFVFRAGITVDVPGVGPVRGDVAFGGAFYFFCEAGPLGVALAPGAAAQLIDLGRRIKRAAAEQCPPVHPFEADLSFLYGVIFTGPPADPRHHSRNVCVFADGEVDRSPTGTGVSARAAIHHARGELAPGQAIAIESLIDTVFEVRVAEVTAFGDYPAVIPEVTGSAAVTGRHRFCFDPDDPLRHGFFIR
ncbi:MAG TPA: proline racemase family protein [Acidobacteriota bacterium]|nr:proline racemase family protein [Acidobacteriota bacterium]HQM63903.1 proline racemase family protein [Acidobacteriota bacterium]